MAMTSNQVGIKQVGVPSDDEPYVVPITAYGATYSGFGQAGLPSEQYPNIPPVAGPIAKPGISQVGTWADGVFIGQYRVSGTIMQYGRWYYKCMVGRAANRAMQVLMTASLYSPNKTMQLFVIGTKGAALSMKLALTGKTSAASQTTYAAQGYLSSFVSKIMKIEGILHGNFDICWPVNGVISPVAKYALKAKGTLQAAVIRTYAVWGKILANAKDAYLIVAHIGSASRSITKATGTLKVKAQKVLKIIGTMQTEIETRFLKITGLLKVPQFIASVPRRLQDFVTNKTWWR